MRASLGGPQLRVPQRASGAADAALERLLLRRVGPDGVRKVCAALGVRCTTAEGGAAAAVQAMFGDGARALRVADG